MKKNFLIIALILLIIPILISAQTSGWRDKGYYKEQILLKDSLISVCFSEDGTKFYTLHYNKIVYYWDFKTGLLIDSLILPKNLKVMKFSRDGNTIIGSSGDIMYKDFQTEYYIINLNSKKLISKFPFKIPENLDYTKPYQDGNLYSKIDYTKLNYNFLDSTFDLAVNFVFSYMSGLGTAYYYTYTDCGGSGIFKVNKDSVIKIIQLKKKPTNDFIKINDIIYITSYDKTDGGGGSSSLNSTDKLHIYDFYKIIGPNFKNLLYNKYESHSDYEQGKPSRDTSWGNDIPLSKIFYDSINKLIYVKAQSMYYCINSEIDQVIGSITLQNNYSLNEIMSKDFQYFIYPNYDTILFHNVITKKFDDILICPFSQPQLQLSPDGRSLLAANDSGNIVLFEKTILDVNENNKSKVDFTISPNPASDFIYLPETNNLIKEATIYSIFGEKVLVMNNSQSNIVDISGLSKGVYFLRINNKSYKFVKI